MIYYLLALAAAYPLFRWLAPPRAVAALDRATPADWAACGLLAGALGLMVAL
jgi:hypothetical protein